MLELAQLYFVSIVQKFVVTADNHSLIGTKSPILRLLPFIYNEGILRVGDHLKNASLSPDEKHPLIMPYDGHLTMLITRSPHHLTLHGGVQLNLRTSGYFVVVKPSKDLSESAAATFVTEQPSAGDL